jgi:hypothetical protein
MHTGAMDTPYNKPCTINKAKTALEYQAPPPMHLTPSQAPRGTTTKHQLPRSCIICSKMLNSSVTLLARQAVLLSPGPIPQVIQPYN